MSILSFRRRNDETTTSRRRRRRRRRRRLRRRRRRRRDTFLGPTVPPARAATADLKGENHVLGIANICDLLRVVTNVTYDHL